MDRGACAEDRGCMVYVARAFDTGAGLPAGRETDLNLALDWYEKICARDEEVGTDSAEWGMDDPPYLLKARMAEILLAGVPAGEGEVRKDPERAGELYNEAAESAMECMKGKLANKYYMLAEEAYGQVEEE